MDSFELNKILGAILATCLVLLVMNFTANALFAPVPPAASSFTAISKPGLAGGTGANSALAVKFMTSSMRQLARSAPRILLSSKESMSNSAPSPKAYDEAG